jgi:hypothetical protein
MISQLANIRHRAIVALACGVAATLMMTATASAQSDTEWGDAYEYIARKAENFNGSETLENKKTAVKAAVKKRSGSDFDAKKSSHVTLVKGYAAMGKNAKAYLAYAGTYKADLKAIAGQVASVGTPIPSALNGGIDGYGMEFYLMEGEFGGAGVVVLSFNIIENDGENEVHFAVGHELGHQFEFTDAVAQFASVRTGNHNWVPSGATTRHAKEYFADGAATRLMKSKGFTRTQVVDAATRLFRFEGDGTEEHPSRSSRVANVGRVYDL